MSKRTIANLGVFLFVFVVLLWWATSNILSVRALEKPYSIKAQFPAASGVLPKAEVAYLGVHYGTVTDVSREPGQVIVTMDIQRGKRIPKESIARIFRKSAIGEPYIDFQPTERFDPKAGDDAYYAKGDTVPQDKTQNPIEFSELLKTASALLANIDPNKAGSLVHELALALDGRSDSLRQITQATDRLASTFAAKTDVLDRLATNNTAITRVLAANAGELGQSITNLRQVADALQNANGDVTVLLDQGRQLVGRLADLVSNEKANLDCTLRGLADVNRVAGAPANLAATSVLLAQGPAGFRTLEKTIDVEPDGPWVRVNLIAQVGSPAGQYSQRLELPPVPTPSPCTSTLKPTATGVDFVPSQALAASEGRTVLPATGRDAALASVALLLAAGLGLRCLARARRRPA